MVTVLTVITVVAAVSVVTEVTVVPIVTVVASVTLHYTILNYTTLQYTTLHYTTLRLRRAIYKSTAFFLRGKMGHGNKFVVPACCKAKIRELCPNPPGVMYVGHKD